MESLLLLAAWMSIGALTAIRFGPSGAVPIAVFFGPFWPAIIEDMSSESVRDRKVVTADGAS